MMVLFRDRHETGDEGDQDGRDRRANQNGRMCETEAALVDLGPGAVRFVGTSFRVGLADCFPEASDSLKPAHPRHHRVGERLKDRQRHRKKRHRQGEGADG